jgi:hypothetical protein
MIGVETQQDTRPKIRKLAGMAGFLGFSALTCEIRADTYGPLSAGGEFRLVGTASPDTLSH